MTWALLKMGALELRRVYDDLHALFENPRLDKKAYNCQSKVNAPVILAEKRVLGRPKSSVPGNWVSRDAVSFLKKMNRVNRKP
jgi:hypothetical protein